MKLTKFERLMLSNQFKILEGLYPKEKKNYELNRKALEEGYSLHYNGAFESLSPVELTEDECREVLDILSMYRALTYSFEKLEDKSGITMESIKFNGFSENDEEESKRLSYTHYFIMDLNRFEELKYGEEWAFFNSFIPMLDSYRRMLSAWTTVNRKQELNRDEIIRIVEER
ncbi:YfbU family protein [Sporosarcina thermotolerans]|uniref:YfbU family protein n=2 Tax=Sporosarcina thermotolerans TaxID=633404 RepID=A0AAW9A968_9BACL|nr:YfbU family protein [Sporosarcina thermotolerans]MDW0116233.1 YfbU family protein [Sporosarcina thermotolerans]